MTTRSARARLIDAKEEFVKTSLVPAYGEKMKKKLALRKKKPVPKK